MNFRHFFFLILILLLATACSRATVPVEPSPVVLPTVAQELEATRTQIATPTEGGIAAEPAVEPTEAVEPATDGVRELTILYTNDEHGWMEGVEEGRGSAEIATLFSERCPDRDKCLLLSGGDMWTGPAISSWFDGESMAEVMNALDYDAAAVGNHEFDFGLEQLQELAQASTFPFVSANLRDKETGETPTDLGIDPYVLVERNGIQIAIIGLSTRLTPLTTLPTYVERFDFINYVDALNEVIPEAVAAGAELIVVPAHICVVEVRQIIRSVPEVDVIGGGHCNELNADVTNETIRLIGGSHFATFAWATLQFDTATDELVSAETGTTINENAAADPGIAAIVEKWRNRAQEELNVSIGYLDRTIENRSREMEVLILNAWLEGVPSADIAVTNTGGMRQTIEAGDLTFGDIVGTMPFDNVIVQLELTGAQFGRILGVRPDVAVYGASRAGVRWILDSTGAPLDNDATYSVLVNDFMYAGGDSFGALAEADPQGYNTAIDWRQPVIDWILMVESSAEAPLNAKIPTQ